MLDHCLYCGVSRAEVNAVRKREGYTLGCVIKSNNQDGFSYEESYPCHKWSPWSDKQLRAVGIKESAMSRYRTASQDVVMGAPCDDTIHGHARVSGETAKLHGLPDGSCIACGVRREERC